MSKYLYGVLIVFITLFIVSCDEMNERVLPSCTGKSGDLLVVIDTAYYNHETGDAIRQVFSSELEGLLQREAKFNLIQVSHKSFARIFHPIRNIIMVKINPESKNKLTITKDVWSESQLLITVTAPSDKLAAETINKNANALLAYYNDKEVERLQEKYAVNKNSSNAKHLGEHLKLRLNIDELYVTAAEDKGFIWMRKEKDVGGHPVSQGIIIYTYPYDNDSIFNVNELVKKRNEFTSKYVKGNVDNAYMVSFPEYTPKQTEINFKGIYLNELRGWWDMKNGFMGGPYVNYSMVDEKRNRVICVDGYVYCPKFDKREFLREQEALIKTITF